MKSKFKLAFILLAIGFILLALDVDVSTGVKYPHDYSNSNNVIGEFQYYNIASNYGAKCTYKLIDTSGSSDSALEKTPLVSGTTDSTGTTQTKVIDKVYFGTVHIDIFNDGLGFILIFIACFLLKKVNKKFSYGSLSAFCGLILHILLKALPFVFNGLLLCNLAMFIGIAYICSIILTTFLFTGGLFAMCPDVCCRDERKWGKITWFVSMVLIVLNTFVFWIGSDYSALQSLGKFSEGLLVIDILIFWIILRRVYYYLEQSYEKAVNA